MKLNFKFECVVLAAICFDITHGGNNYNNIKEKGKSKKFEEPNRKSNASSSINSSSKLTFKTRRSNRYKWNVDELLTFDQTAAESISKVKISENKTESNDNNYCRAVSLGVEAAYLKEPNKGNHEFNFIMLKRVSLVNDGNLVIYENFVSPPKIKMDKLLYDEHGQPNMQSEHRSGEKSLFKVERDLRPKIEGKILIIYSIVPTISQLGLSHPLWKIRSTICLSKFVDIIIRPRFMNNATYALSRFMFYLLGEEIPFPTTSLEQAQVNLRLYEHFQVEWESEISAIEKENVDELENGASSLGKKLSLKKHVGFHCDNSDYPLWLFFNRRIPRMRYSYGVHFEMDPEDKEPIRITMVSAAGEEILTGNIDQTNPNRSKTIQRVKNKIMDELIYRNATLVGYDVFSSLNRIFDISKDYQKQTVDVRRIRYNGILDPNLTLKEYAAKYLHVNYPHRYKSYLMAKIALQLYKVYYLKISDSEKQIYQNK